MPIGLNRRDAASRDLPLLLVGTDYRCAPLELRERVAYGAAEAEDVLVHLLADPAIDEALLLSTCNRTEIYLRHRNEEDAFRAASPPCSSGARRRSRKRAASTSSAAARRRATCSRSPAGSSRWCSASPRSSAR